MDGLIIGFDLCDSYTRISVYDPETKEPVEWAFEEGIYEIPTTVCKGRKRSEWYIGQAASRMALLGSGIVVDKLLNNVKKGKKSTLEGTSYNSRKLMEIFIGKALDDLKKSYSKDIDRLIFTLSELDPLLMDEIMKSAENLGYGSDRTVILSHSESYMYFLLHQQPDIFANAAVCMDLSSEGLRYYECNIKRGVVPQIASTFTEELEEGFSLNIFESEKGMQIADNIMQSCVDRQFGRKIITSVFLAGRGMADIQSWGKNTLAKICRQRKVFLEEALFAKGAALMGASLEYPEDVSYNYRMIGNGRILAEVSMNMQIKGVKKSLVLLSAGDRWYRNTGVVEFMLDGSDALNLYITPAGTKKAVLRRISLGEMPVRQKKTTRVHLEVEFVSENTLKVTVSDMGFGDIFPSSGYVYSTEMSL